MDKSDRIPTNMRTLLILETLGASTDPMTPAEIGRRIDLPKQTTHRLCNTLIEEGFLVRDERRRGLRPGRRARSLASGLLHSSTVHSARHQVLQELAREIGETVNFVVPEDRGMAYHDRVETNWAFRVQLPVGSHVPFHCTASGKAYLASLPKSQRRRLVQVMQLEAVTGNSITQPSELLAELQAIAKQGYALDNQEFIEGMIAIAVPVKDEAGRYCASVAFHGPIQRVSKAQAVAMVPKIKMASRKLQHTLFGDAD